MCRLDIRGYRMAQVEKHQRAPTTLGVSLTQGKEHMTRQQGIALGRQGTLEQIVQVAKACVRRAGALSDVTVLGLCLSNMTPLGATPLSQFFGKRPGAPPAGAGAAQEPAQKAPKRAPKARAPWRFA